MRCTAPIICQQARTAATKKTSFSLAAPSAQIPPAKRAVLARGSSPWCPPCSGHLGNKAVGCIAYQLAPVCACGCSLTASVYWARAMPTYIRRRSSAVVPGSREQRRAQRCQFVHRVGLSLGLERQHAAHAHQHHVGHSSPLRDARWTKRDHIAVFHAFRSGWTAAQWSAPPPAVTFLSWLAPGQPHRLSATPQRWAIQSQNSSTRGSSAPANRSLSSLSYRCFRNPAL